MKVKLKRQVKFADKAYAIGIHEMPDALADNWYFKALVKDKHAEILGAEKAPEKSAAPVMPEPVKPESITDDSGFVPEVAEDAAEAEKDQKHRGNKKQR